MQRRPHSFLASQGALAVAIGLVAACGDDPSAPARIKLVDVAVAATTSPAVGATETLLREDFASGASNWRVVTDPEHPLEPRADDLSVETASADGRTLLTLRGRRGALFRVLPAEPATCYELSGLVRARGVRPVGDAFFGATIWMAEVHDFAAPDELLADGLDEVVETVHSFPSAYGGASGADREGRWQERRRIVRTGPRTRGLIVACVLSFTEEVRAGEVDFTALELARVPLPRYWDVLRAEALAEVAAGEPPAEGWRRERLVRAQLGAEVRPSIVCFPGETVRFHLRLPAGRPRLETGVGVWLPALQPGGGRAQDFVVRVDGDERLRLAREAPASPYDARWHEARVDLADRAGELVTLELTVEGDLPGVYGAPTVHDVAVRPPGRNVLLISIDTLRADRVGCYGYEGGTTPRLDAFAREGIRFANVTAQAPYTLPSHASLFSGQFPSVHGVERQEMVLSSTRSPILARILGERGYRTQAFTGGGYVNADFGFDKGFDGFANIDPLRHRSSSFFAAMVEEAEPMILHRLRRAGKTPTRVTRELVNEYGPERVHAWIREHADEPFFLFVHTYTVHDYDAPREYLTCRDQGCKSTREDYWEFNITRKNGWVPQPVSDVDREHIGHLYDAALRFTDRLVGELLDVLDEAGLRDDTIVAITTDHGEELFERGFVQHGKTLYEELTSIPMMIRVPGVAPRVIEEPAMMIDLAPTILGALGIPRDPRMQGLDRLADGPPERPLWSEVHDDFVHKYAMHTGDGWKLLYAPPDDEVEFPAKKEWELYDLNRDAGERDDLSATDPQRLERMSAELLDHRDLLRSLAENLGEAGRAELGEETLLQLERLGY